MRRSRHRVTLAVTLAVLGAGFSAPARAFVRTKTTPKDGSGYTPQEMCWCNPGAIRMNILTGSAPANIDATLFVNAAKTAALQWDTATLSCTSLGLYAEGASLAPMVAADSSNRVMFATNRWCLPAGQKDMGTCPYDGSALAVTSVWANQKTGNIVDTDVEINGFGFKWADLVAHPEQNDGNTQDLQNTLTHEFGHVAGFDHTCSNGASTNVVDDQGHTIPTCERAPQSVRDTTMFAAVIAGDTARRTLATDDQKAACTVYPVDGGPLCTCLPPQDGGGCSYAPGARGTAGLGGLVLAALGLGLTRRRGRATARAASETRSARSRGR